MTMSMTRKGVVKIDLPVTTTTTFDDPVGNLAAEAEGQAAVRPSAKPASDYVAPLWLIAFALAALAGVAVYYVSQGGTTKQSTLAPTATQADLVTPPAASISAPVAPASIHEAQHGGALSTEKAASMKVRAVEVEIVPLNLTKTDGQHVLLGQNCPPGSKGKKYKVDAGKNSRGEQMWDWYRCR